jgi:hypothetical protein
MLYGTSIGQKQILIVMLFSGFAILLAGGAFISRDVMSLRRSLLRDAMVLAEVMGLNSKTALRNGDRDLASGILSTLAAHDDLTRAALFDEAGEVFARYSRTGDIGPGFSGISRTPGHEFSCGRLKVINPVEADGVWLGST